MINSKGLTLMEAIIVLAILAIMASIAIPSFMAQRANSTLKDTVSLIRGDFEMAKSWAIRENAFVTILLNDEGYTIFIDNGAGSLGVAGDWTPNGDERVLSVRKFPAGVSLNQSKTTFSGGRTRFNGRGIITNNGIITIESSTGKSSTLDMNNRFGRVEIY